jgi:two-component system, sensor histidine kinase
MCCLLLIDDDPTILLALGAVMDSWGCEVIKAGSVAESFEFAQPQVEGIVADYRLQNGETGLMAIRAVWEKLGRVVPSIIITGDTAVGRLVELEASELTVRHKPIMPKELWKVLADKLSDRCAAFRTIPRGMGNLV